MSAITLLSFAALLALSAAAARAADPASPATQPYPSTTLKSSTLEVSLYLPDPDHAFYRGSRFDGSGIISQVQYQGHSFYGDWRIPHDSNPNDNAVGTAEEFGMQTPLNYKGTAPGESFIKIGVGQQKRAKEDSYGFWNNYPITQYYPFVINQGPDSIQFVQTAPAHNGYAYTYTKKITLDKTAPVVTITHTLKNTGEKVIDTNWYCHNFTIIDDTPLGPAYTLEFPFPIKAPAPTKTDLKADQAWAELAKVEGRKLAFLKPIDDNHSLKASWDTPVPNQAADNAFTVTNTRTGAALKVTADFPIKTFAFFAVRLALCPEPFLEIHLAPNEEKTWTTIYTFSATNK